MARLILPSTLLILWIFAVFGGQSDSPSAEVASAETVPVGGVSSPDLVATGDRLLAMSADGAGFGNVSHEWLSVMGILCASIIVALRRRVRLQGARRS